MHTIRMVGAWYKEELSRFFRYVKNGFLGIPKSEMEMGTPGSQRITIDGRPGNSNLPKLANPCLSDPRDSGRAYLRPGRAVVGGATDFSAYLYTLKVALVIEGVQSIRLVTVPHEALIEEK